MFYDILYYSVCVWWEIFSRNVYSRKHDILIRRIIDIVCIFSLHNKTVDLRFTVMY